MYFTLQQTIINKFLLIINKLLNIEVVLTTII